MMKNSFRLLGIPGILIPNLISCGSPANKPSEESRPNFIVILADDLGWNDVGYHGSEIKTPNIDRMATEGIRFDNFYVHSVSSPTRCGLLTGRYPSRFNILSPLGDKTHFAPGTMTIARLLQNSGYETAISGKWHLGAEPSGRPKKFGFESTYGYLHGQVDPIGHLYKTGVKTWHRNDEFIEEEGHATDLITTEAIRVISGKRPANKPFFLYVTYSVPHYPLDEPAEWRNMYNDVQNKSRAHFNASVSHMDNSIGKIIDAVKKAGIEKNTLILFISDNGGQKSWNSPKSEYNGKFEPNDVLGNNLPLRDWKGSLYDGALRVPAVMLWEGKVSSMKIDQPVNVSDIFPTLAFLAGTTLPEELQLDGINFWPAVEKNDISAERSMYWKLAIGRAVRKGDWKLIHYDSKSDDGKEELYNVALDPYETKDILQQNTEKADELRSELIKQTKIDSTSMMILKKQ